MLCLFTFIVHSFLSFYSGIKSLIAAKYVRKKKKSIFVDQYHTDIFFFFSLIRSISAFEEVCIVERVLSKSFITIVSDQAPRKLNVLDIKRGTELHTYKYSTNIMAVRISRSVRKEYWILLLFGNVNSFQRLVVCLLEEIWIHDMRDLKVIHIIREVPANNNGLIALSSSDDSPYLAFPKSSVTGEIQIFDTIKLVSANRLQLKCYLSLLQKDVCVFHAHDSPIIAMALDISGARIGSASTKVF